MTVDLLRCAELFNLWKSMEANKADYPEADYQAKRAIPTPQQSIYGNFALYSSMLAIQERWYNTNSDHVFQTDLRKMLADAFESATIQAFAAQALPAAKMDVLEILYTRPQRWELLAQYYGLKQAPDSFVIYRATDWKPAIESVLRAWRDGLVLFRVPHIGLSSWSLFRGDSQIPGALSHLSQHRNGALLQARIPLSETFMDVLVDDGVFARFGLGECEIVVGYGRSEVNITGDSRECVLRLSGTPYEFNQRQEASVVAKSLGFQF